MKSITVELVSSSGGDRSGHYRQLHRDAVPQVVCWVYGVGVHPRPLAVPGRSRVYPDLQWWTVRRSEHQLSGLYRAEDWYQLVIRQVLRLWCLGTCRSLFDRDSVPVQSRQVGCGGLQVRWCIHLGCVLSHDSANLHGDRYGSTLGGMLTVHGLSSQCGKLRRYG